LSTVTMWLSRSTPSASPLPLTPLTKPTGARTRSQTTPMSTGGGLVTNGATTGAGRSASSSASRRVLGG
jgi:hypothetical protein